MHFVAIVASVLVGAVFLVSAVTKIAAPVVWRSQAANLGVPSPVVVALPVIEAFVGAVLVVQWHRRLAGVAALVLLVAFTLLLVVRIGQGRRPPCACFGSFSTQPISWFHVARNAAFIALAVVVVAVR